MEDGRPARQEDGLFLTGGTPVLHQLRPAGGT